MTTSARTLVFFLLAAACSACAGETKRDVAPSSQTFVEPAPRAIEDLPLRRDRVDRGEWIPACEGEGQSVDARWLQMWCGFRHQSWAMVRERARALIPRFEARSELRRQAEAWLMIAIAEHESAGAPAEALARAEQLMSTAHMPLAGPAMDAFAGDLAYLIAYARASGLPVTLREGVAQRTSSIAQLAWFDYETTGRRTALPHLARLKARVALSEGRLRDAMVALRHALALDRAQGNVAGLQASFQIALALGRALGTPELEAQLRPVSRIELEPAILVGSTELAFDDLGALARTAAGRTRLARRIRSLREQTQPAPRALLVGLQDPQILAAITASGWELPYEAGLVLREAGRYETSRRYLEAAVDNAEEARRQLGEHALRQHFLSDRRPLYLALIDSYVGIDTSQRAQSDYRRGLEIANAIKARGLLDLLHGASAPESVALAARPRPFTDPVRQARALEERLARWTTAPAPSPGFDPQGLHRVVRSLSEEAAILEYIVAPRRSYVWVLTSRGLQVRRLAGSETLVPLLAEFRRHLSEPALDPAMRAKLRATAERLYVELLGPIQDIVAHTERLIIAPDSEIYQLPFEALARPSKEARPRYVVHSHAVSYIPSTAVLERLRARRLPPPSQQVLFMGDPDVERPAASLLGLLPEVPDDLPDSLSQIFRPLAGARAEIRSLARAWGGASEVLAGRAATEDVLRRAASYRILHIAAHSVSDADTRAEGLVVRQPALVLDHADDGPHDGLLTLDEVLSLPTRAELVVLSGCSTGRGWRALGEGAFGLAGAFLYAGSRSVVATGWPVSDTHTAALMTQLYAALESQASPAEALRRAQRRILARHPEPFYWAGFHVVGS